MSWQLEVEVALSRPPRADAVIYFELSEEYTAHEAELLAQQWAASTPRVVMPVSSLITDWPE